MATWLLASWVSFFRPNVLGRMFLAGCVAGGDKMLDAAQGAASQASVDEHGGRKLVQWSVNRVGCAHLL